MAYEIEAALITVGGAIAAALMTVYLPSVRERKNESRFELARQSTIDVMEIAQSLPPGNVLPEVDNVPARFQEFLSDRPFDTSIAVGMGEEWLAFRIPGGRQNIFPIVFSIGWLAAWTAGIFVASMFFLTSLFAPRGADNDGSFTTVFMAGWLIAAIAAEFTVIRSTTNSLVTMFGSQYIGATVDRMTVLRKLFFVRSKSVFAAKYLKRVRGTDGGLKFDYGKTMCSLDGITEIEGKWIGIGLSALYGRKILELLQ